MGFFLHRDRNEKAAGGRCRGDEQKQVTEMGWKGSRLGGQAWRRVLKLTRDEVFKPSRDIVAGLF